ncbi:MAG: hypothetical protein SangKO_075600 [Sandaracinaceae bacterium]
MASDVESKMDELGAQRLELEAAAWGQLFGGGLLLIGAADGRSSHEPLDVDNLQRIEWLRVAPAHNAWVVGYVDSPGHPTHGQPSCTTSGRRFTPKRRAALTATTRPG